MGSTSQPILWKNREATRLTNGVVELVALTSGGHLAEFRFLEHNGGASPNTFWEAPWPTFDPGERAGDDLPASYGPVEVRRFLASYTGHCLCLDYFGGPSAEQAAVGCSLHGEAPNTRWNLVSTAVPGEALVRWKVELPVSTPWLRARDSLGCG